MLAIWLITSHKKGIASTQLAKDIGVTQKTAWFMTHRLRYAIKTQSFNRPLDGTIEADETFIGGKEKNKHAHQRQRGQVRLYSSDDGGRRNFCLSDVLKLSLVRSMVDFGLKVEDADRLAA